MLHNYCPICESTKFEPYGSRPLGRCSRCKALERTRVIYAVFKELNLFQPKKRLLHIAPEAALVSRFTKIYGSRYTVADIRPEALESYRGSIDKVVFDMTAISPEMEARRFDIILHSHILEHLRGNWALALLRLDSLLKPGGYHIFAIPLLRDWSCEDLADMAASKRKARFGQHDHMRYIGRNDFTSDMLSVEKIADPEFFKSSSELIKPNMMAAMVGDPDVFVMKKREKLLIFKKYVFSILALLLNHGAR